MTNAAKFSVGNCLEAKQLLLTEAALAELGLRLGAQSKEVQDA